MNTEIEKCLEVLQEGGIILYPTDTLWGIGCDATNASAVEKIIQLKKRGDKKSFICLVDSFRMLEKHAEEVPDAAYDIIEYSDRPTTIVYDNPLGIAKNLIPEDNSIGIRLTDDEFCIRLIQRLRKPLVSTSANISGMSPPLSFSEIDPIILNGVDYVVNLHRDKISSRPSVIIKLKNNGEVKIIRK